MLGRHQGDNGFAIKHRVFRLAARGRGASEDRAAQFHRMKGRAFFEFATVEHQFQQATGQALLARLHIDGATGIRQGAARLTDMGTGKVEIGGGQLQCARSFLGRDRDHEETVSAPAHVYQVSGKQCVRASAD